MLYSFTVSWFVLFMFLTLKSESFLWQNDLDLIKRVLTLFESVAAKRSNELGQQQTSKHGSCRQPEAATDGTRRPLSVGGKVVVGSEGRGTVKPSSSYVTWVAAPDVHVDVAEFPIVVVLEEIRTTLTFNKTNAQTTITTTFDFSF